jgi:hypothetical protein
MTGSGVTRRLGEGEWRIVWHHGANRQRWRRRGDRRAFFAIEAARSARLALLAASALFALSIVACAAFLSWMRHALPPDTRCLNP